MGQVEFLTYCVTKKKFNLTHSVKLRLAVKDGLAEFGRGAAVRLTEGGAEMAVAGEAEIEAQSGEVVVAGEEIESTRKAQTQLIAVQRQAFDLLENLREINGRAANFRGDFRERPTAGQVACENELDAVNEALASEAGAGRV